MQTVYGRLCDLSVQAEDRGAAGIAQLAADAALHISVLESRAHKDEMAKKLLCAERERLIKQLEFVRNKYPAVYVESSKAV